LPLWKRKLLSRNIGGDTMRSVMKTRIAKLEQARLPLAMPGLQVYCSLPSLGHEVLLLDTTGTQEPVSDAELTALHELDEKRGEAVRRNLLSRVAKLEAGRGPLAPVNIIVRETPEDIRQGRELWDLALEQNLVPAAVLEGRQRIGILVPAKVPLEQWDEYRRAYEDSDASLPRCPQCRTKLWNADHCAVCEGQHGRPSAPGQSH
jgi:hypothetical protein